MSYRPSTSHFLFVVVLAAGQDAQSQGGPVSITLTPTTSPTAGEPGVTNISVTGSSFPAGTIPAANVMVSLTPTAGGTAVTTPASAVATVIGSTRRVSFTIPSSVNVATPTAYSASISGSTSSNTAFASSNTASLTVNPLASITSVTPNGAQPGQTLPVAIVGSFSNFLQGATIATFGAGITINSITVTNATHASVNIAIGSTASTGPRIVTLTTGPETATQANGFTVIPPSSPTITDFNPKSAPAGTLVTVTGTNLQPNTGTAAQITLVKQGGATLNALASSATATSLTFVIPAGAATGAFSVTVNGGSGTSPSTLTITPASTFTLNAAPSTANVIQGQSAAYAISLSTANGFNQLATLSLSGLPTGVTASFGPQQITAGQTSVLTVSAPSGQPTGGATLTASAVATVNGIAVIQSSPLTLNVNPVTTSFLGRTVVSDSAEIPLAGVTIKMLGLDGNGNTTGCSGSTVSDGAGNFAMTNLPPMCVGPQLISFDGTTATSPSGKYAGVNLVFTFASGQVTVSPVLVHLPRIDNVETFLVTQNSASNQSYSFTTIPGLSVTVYAGTTFTLADGTQPNPFPLAAIQVPVDRLPDAKPQVPTMMRAFIVAFQPANATTNEPVAVYFPNTLNTPPGTDMALMTLDPTHGQMVPYGTGAVSSDGSQIVPDPDPAHPGHLYGLIHFDWHGPMPPPPAQSNPGPPGGGLTPPGGGAACGPGAGPAGGYGPGGAGCASPTPTVPPVTNLPTPTSTPGFCPAAKNDPRGLENADPPAQLGDPVDLFSGIQVITNTDIAFSGSRGSLGLTRTYRSLTSNPGPFGIGTGHNYALQLDTSNLIRSGEGIINLVMPDGNHYPFYRTLTGTFLNYTLPSFQGVVLSNPSSGIYQLRFRDGTLYKFQTSALGALEAFLSAITDRNGNATSIIWNPSQPLQITQVTDPVGRSLTFTYDGANRITSVTDPIGRTVQYAYNAQGTLASVTDPAGGITRYTYDAGNNMLTVADARGIVQAQNTLDSVGRVIEQVRPDGGTLTFSYLFLNPLASSSQVMQAQITDSQGVQATYRFNPIGFVTDVTATGGQRRLLPRAPGSNLLTAVTESSSTQTYTYDANGNILSSTDPTGLTTQFTYDPVFNKITSITDPLGNVSRFTYDANGNLLTSADAKGNISSYQYDPTGLVLQATDALNQKTTFTYDGFGNLSSSTDPLGNTTSYAYDAISRLVQTKDSLGRVTSFTYDPLGRLLTRTDAKAGVTTFTYDPDGNLLTVKDARNNLTTFTYDVMNRLATRTNPLGQTDTRTYDTNGNLVKFVDRRGQTSTFTYDNLNRLTTETYSDATVTLSYDVLGRLSQVTDSASGLFTFTYDAAGRLTVSSTPFGSVDYFYDGRGSMASRQVAGQPAVTYSYDPAWNLSSASMPQASAGFAYNPRNQIASITRLNNVSTSFNYDADARLLSLTHANGASIIDSEGYTYDAVGNRAGHSTSIGQPLITPPTTNLFNAANQLTQFGSVPDSYDANGNLIQEGSANTYTWDGRSRLKSIVTSSGQTTTFTYDFAGNLLGQADSGPSLNLSKTFVLDDLTNVVYEAANDGTSYSTLSGRSIDSHLAIVQSSGQVQYSLADAINSTVATVDQSGTLKSQVLYEPFGQATTTSAFPFQFTGRMPVSSAVDYYRARFYNSQTGRFISEDPLRDDTNLYRYALNRPTFLADPTGLQAGSGDFNVIPSGPTAVNGYYQPAVPTAPGYFPYGDYYNQQLISWATNKIIGDLLGELPAGGLLEKLFGNLTPYEYILPPAPSLSGVACSIGPGTPTIIRGANPYQFQVNNSNGTFNGSFIP